MTVFRLKLNEQRKVKRGKLKLHLHSVFQLLNNLQSKIHQPYLFIQTPKQSSKYGTLKTRLEAKGLKPPLQYYVECSEKCNPIPFWSKGLRPGTMQAKPGPLLNKRSELVSKCRYKAKFLLKNIV